MKTTRVTNTTKGWREGSKASILKGLKKYLELVHTIAELEVVWIRIGEYNDFTSDQLNAFDKVGRLSAFVSVSNFLSDMRQSKKRKVEAIKKISQKNGTSIKRKK